MHFIRVDHIDLVIADLNKSGEFYRKFDMHPEGSVAGGTTVFMFNGEQVNSVRLELHQAKPGQKTGLDHIAFGVSDPKDATKEIQFLGGVKFEFEFEPFENQQSGGTI